MTAEQIVQDQLAVLTPAQRAALEQRLGALQPNGAKIVPLPSLDRHCPFQMTDIQQAYWAGRRGDFAFGNVATHSYTEIDGAGLELDRLNAAWNGLVMRHDMLRAVFLSNGTQRVLEDVPPYHIAITDLRGLKLQEIEASLMRLRQEMSHQCLPADCWPLFDIRASLHDTGRVRIHLSFDAIIADMSSRRALMCEWGLLYNNNNTALKPLTASFQDFVLTDQARKSSPSYVRAKSYWLERVETLPAPPALPVQGDNNSQAPFFFTRRSRRFAATQKLYLERLAKSFGVSLNTLLLIAYADVLRLWSQNASFTLNLTLFNRPPNYARVVGDFTTLTLLEISTPGDGNLAARAVQLQSQLWRDLDHRQFSGVEVLREITRRRTSVGRPVMPFVFTSLLTSEADDSPVLGWMGEEVYGVSQTPQVWLDLMVSSQDGELIIHWNAIEDLFPAGLMEEMFHAFERYLAQLAGGTLEATSGWCQIAQTLLPAPAVKLQAAANATTGPQPQRLLHEPWKDYAAASPERMAVIAPAHNISHGQLANLATGLGRRLRVRGVQPNMLVAVVMHKGWEQIAAVLGIMESGGAYLPLDPELPLARLHYLMSDAKISIVLTQPALLEKIVWPEHILCTAITAEDLTVAPSAPLPRAQTLSDLAYVIYTSGSSGQPKGVAIEHRAAANTVADINARFGVGPGDRVLALSALNFDLSVYDIFGVLAAGGTLVVPGPSGLRDPAYWAELMRHHGVTLWNSVPALAELLADYTTVPFPALRLVLLSGDRIACTLPPAVQAMAPGARIISLGGATEASIWSIFHETDTPVIGCTTVPYGKPLRNQTVHVLASDGVPRPLHVPGELYIGGSGLARCYWGDPAKTEAAFSLNEETGERLYRTGDRGRYLPDGNIEFLGREDQQIKLHGYRIEIGEVESALAVHPAIKEAVVLALDTGTAAERSLAGFVVLHAPCSATVEVLRAYLCMQLPGYMVPAQIIIMPALPLTPNGKIDRHQLALAPHPAPWIEVPSHGPHAESIAQLVRQACRISIPSMESNFLDLGLNSIDIIRIVNAIDAQLGFRPEIESLYASPTMAWLAARYTEWQAESGAVAPAPPSLEKHFPQATGAALALPVSPMAAGLEAMLRSRRSVRQFALRPVRLEDVSALLVGMQPADGHYVYASASNLYPVQIYLYAKPGRIAGLPPGGYIYDPAAHALCPLGREKSPPRTAFTQHQNVPMFDEAGFVLLLVAEMSRIEPLYAKRSLHLATLEAGLMTQTLELAAVSCGLGLCQIGTIDIGATRHLCGFTHTQEILHVIFGGYPDASSHHTMPPDASEEGRLKRLFQRVKQISPETARALLSACHDARE